jgi:membrane associated rhomboid family serine protease
MSPRSLPDVHERQPIFNAPAVVVALLGAFAMVHLARVLLSTFVSEAADDQLVQLLAFDPTRLGGGDVAGGPAAVATQFVTHVFVHGDFTHLIINSAWFLVFATPVERRIGTARFLAFFLLCGVGGALLYLPFNAAPMVGASGAISGLMGAAIRFLFVPLSQRDLEALADAQRPPLLSLGASLGDRRILFVIAGWTVLNVLVAWAAPLVLDERSIAWQAHLGGFFTGFLSFGWFDPKPPVQHDSPPAE